MVKTKFNIRTCIICKKKLLKTSLIRLCIKNKILYIDINNSLHNKGYYLCNLKSHFEKLINHEIKQFKNFALDDNINIYVKEYYG